MIDKAIANQSVLFQIELPLRGEFPTGSVCGHSGTAVYRILGDLADIPATNLGASMGQPYTLRM